MPNTGQDRRSVTTIYRLRQDGNQIESKPVYADSLYDWRRSAAKRH